MKTRTLFFSLLSLITPLLSAQNWEPFPVGTQLYYSQQRGDSSIIQRADVSAPGNNVVLLNTPLCPFWPPYYLLDGLHDITLVSSDKPTYVEKQDSLYLFHYISFFPQYPPFDLTRQFHFMLEPGQSFSDQESSIMCLAKDTMTVFGQIDSIKSFSYIYQSDTSEIQLSKSFGLLTLPQVLYSDQNPLNLIGFHDSTTTLGYLQPTFDDYFDLHPGDLIYWYRFRHGYFLGEKEIIKDTTYLIDTILSVTKNATHISYTTRRSTLSLRGIPLNTSTDNAQYYRKGQGIYVEGTPGWINQDPSEFMLDPIIFSALTQHEENSITRSTAWVKLIGEYVDSDCETNVIYDRGGDYAYQTPIGLVYLRNYGISGTEYRKVIGSVIDGIPSGITEIPMTSAISEFTADGAVISPNPTSGIVVLTGNEIQRADIYDLQGRCLLSEVHPETQLDLSGLSPGIYLLHFTWTDGSRSVARIARQ